MRDASFRTKVLLTILLLALLSVAPVASSYASGEPVLGLAKQQTYTIYPATALTGSAQTAYSSAPNLDAFSRDASYSNGWNSADVFIGADVTGTAFLTVTVQLSPDQSNWADADYEYATDSAIATQTFVRYMQADGTEYMRVPLAGEYMRVKVENTGTVTPTVWATYRN